MSPREASGGAAVAPARGDGRPDSAPDQRGPRVPWSQEGEISVLGALLIDAEAIHEIPELRAEHFYHEANRRIYRVAQELAREGEPIDVVTLSDALEARGELEAAGGMAYLAQLVDAVPTAANIKYHCKIVRDHAVLREIVDAGGQMVEEARSADRGEAAELLDRAETRLMELSESSSSGDEPVAAGEVVFDVLEQAEREREAPELSRRLELGIRGLDQKTGGGVQPGDLVVVAGRPGMGKTALSLQMAGHVGIDLGRPVLLFSLEMSRDELARRLLCQRSRLPWRRIQQVAGGAGDDRDGEYLAQAASEINGAPIRMHDQPAMTPLEIRSVARREHRRAEDGLGLVVVDYLQLMSGPRDAGTREQEVSAMSRGLKALSRELDVPVVAVSQLSRAPEERNSGRPRLSDLRASGAIEQDADRVFMLWRPEEYLGEEHRGRDLRNHAEVLVAKQRNGPTGSVTLTFEAAVTRFADAPSADPVQG